MRPVPPARWISEDGLVDVDTEGGRPFVDFHRGFRIADRDTAKVYVESVGWELDLDGEDVPLDSGHRCYLKPIE